MFTHQHHLEYLLRPEHYTTEQHYRAELRHLFRPAWHPLASTSELARPGDYLTFDLLETPILLRNCGGELRAFLNVCPHRHYTIASQPRGRAETIRCGYHGWEFDDFGRTGRIPDARAFRPWDRDNSCLHRFRVETCGDLVFVNLSDAGPSLREWLGPVWGPWSTYAHPYRHSRTWEKDFPCNWKVVLENSLESYHIPAVHPKTFKEYPAAENAWHELTDTFTSFRTIPPRDFPGRAMDWMVRRLGAPVTGEYWHRVRHPHATGSSLDVFRMMQCVFPTGPTTCRYRCIFFTLKNTKTGPVRWAMSRFLKWFSTLIAYKVFGEDGSIYAGVQRGLEATTHRGVIGTREERVYYFQNYVLDHARGPAELPTLEPASTID